MSEIKKDVRDLGNPQSRVPDVDKRKFIKKGFLALLAGVGAAILAKIPFVRGVNYVRNTQVTEPVNALGDLGGGTDDIDLTKGDIVTATVSTSAETFTFSNPPESGMVGSFKLFLTDGGSQTVNWPASVSWMTSEAPTLVTSGVDILRFRTTDGGTTWYGWVEGNTALVGDIGLFGGGGEFSNSIEYIQIASEGNGTDFGDLTVDMYNDSAVSSSTRGVFGATSGAGGNVLCYVTIVTKGNATDFGDLLVTRSNSAGCGSLTRGLFSGGSGLSNVISHITIASTGNATNFGDLVSKRSSLGACSSPTRGVIGGGDLDGPTTNVIEYVTIATTSNTTDFGDLTAAGRYMACSNSTRGLFADGYTGGTYKNIIEYITIATTGNATDFGDLTAKQSNLAACASSTRGLFGGGRLTGGTVNTICFVTIASIGNATDFGDLTGATDQKFGACSNAHGGVQ